MDNFEDIGREQLKDALKALEKTFDDIMESANKIKKDLKELNKKVDKHFEDTVDATIAIEKLNDMMRGDEDE